jgi:hypothetical protein
MLPLDRPELLCSRVACSDPFEWARDAASSVTAEASPKGWVVRATIKRLGGKPPAVEIYDVAIPDPEGALDAVRRVYGASPDTVLEIVSELLSGTDLRDGEVLLR